MKTTKFSYDVSLYVEFTEEEFNLIRNSATSHYDGKVKASTKQGGFIYGWGNHLRWNKEAGNDSFLVACSFRELDLCGKALEQSFSSEEDGGVARWVLRDVIVKILRSINEEEGRINKDGEGDALRQLVAVYQGEGEDEFPEETEYKTLMKISGGTRTEKQTKRLRELAILIRELHEIRDSLSVEILRSRLAERAGVTP